MVRFGNFGRRQRLLSGIAEGGGAADRQAPTIVPHEDYSPYGYESPRLLVIGGVRKLVTGSSSSGKADANSQYYW